jgi:hypothetical protein
MIPYHERKIQKIKIKTWKCGAIAVAGLEPDIPAVPTVTYDIRRCSFGFNPLS